jgi:hypothetical protein
MFEEWAVKSLTVLGKASLKNKNLRFVDQSLQPQDFDQSSAAGGTDALKN